MGVFSRFRRKADEAVDESDAPQDTAEEGGQAAESDSSADSDKQS